MTYNELCSIAPLNGGHVLTIQCEDLCTLGIERAFTTLPTGNSDAVTVAKQFCDAEWAN